MRDLQGGSPNAQLAQVEFSSLSRHSPQESQRDVTSYTPGCRDTISRADSHEVSMDQLCDAKRQRLPQVNEVSLRQHSCDR